MRDRFLATLSFFALMFLVFLAGIAVSYLNLPTYGFLVKT